MLASQSQPQLFGFLASGDHGTGLFNRKMGPLQRQLRLGEYDLLKFAPMLESDFLQVNKRGEMIDVHNQVEPMTVAAACTKLPLETPDVLLLARSVQPTEENLPPLQNLLSQYPPPKAYELTRLLPLPFVKISVHNFRKQQLRFKLASGRAFYLQLCSQPGQPEDLFESWVKVVNLLRPPSEEKLESQTKAGDREAPAQRPESPTPINLEDTVSIRTVYSFSKAPSPTQDDARSRKSMAASLGSQHSTEGPPISTIPAQEKTSEEEEALEGSSSHQNLSPVEEEEYRSSPPSNRRSRRKSRSKSPRKATSRKPSKILSLITSCSWGSQKSRTRESKGKTKGKKH